MPLDHCQYMPKMSMNLTDSPRMHTITSAVQSRLPLESLTGKANSMILRTYQHDCHLRLPLSILAYSILLPLSPLFLCTLAYLCYLITADYRRTLKMPPGPLPLPLLGNKWCLPLRKPWYTFKQWTDTYGSIVTFWTGRRPTIVIGDPKVACDLLDRRSAIYSSRPRFVVMGELFTNNDSLLTMPYGERWRATRKVFHVGLHQKACESYKPIQESESCRLVRDLLKAPGLFGQHVERYTASVMVCVAYGRRVDRLDDPVVRKVYERMGYMATLNVPGAFWAESFPILKGIPDCLAPWKREVKRRGEEGTRLLAQLAMDVKRQMEENEDTPPSFTKTLWEKRQKDPEWITDREIAYATGSLFGAGSDTTAATLMSFILAMVRFPQAALKAQEEIDRVIPYNRSPTLEDQPNLPYCNAIIKETLRWRPVAVMGGTPHANIEDDHYDGHFIPKGTTILGNLWAIHHNEKYFKDSHSFIPERYLAGYDEGMEPYPNRDGHSSFGWGRRICPGKLLAENSLFMAITKILWGFRISTARDKFGNEIIPNIFAYTDGFNSKPHPFQCEIKVRSPAIQAIIEREAELGERFLDRYLYKTKTSQS